MNIKHLPDFFMDENGQAVAGADWDRQRERIKSMLFEYEYGIMPGKPDSLEFVREIKVDDYCAGKAVYEKISAEGTVCGKSFSFPFYAVVPVKQNKPPAFVHINFRDNVPDQYMPTEEIIDNGFAVFSFGYQDVTADNDDFSDGAAALFSRNEDNAPGKIAVWAWAASIVMDYVCSRGDIGDTAVVGHSRLGKTALLAGAVDERFKFVISNDSGCGGAAVTRGKKGERIADIVGAFPFWFCKNYGSFSRCEESMPFDQHFLLALAAPRYLYVASAKEDIWADPEAEFEGCAEASRAWELLGLNGLEKPGCKGHIGYHNRDGTHYLSRYDWQKFMEFIKTH